MLSQSLEACAACWTELASTPFGSSARQRHHFILDRCLSREAARGDLGLGPVSAHITRLQTPGFVQPSAGVSERDARGSRVMSARRERPALGRRETAIDQVRAHLGELLLERGMLAHEGLIHAARELCLAEHEAQLAAMLGLIRNRGRAAVDRCACARSAAVTLPTISAMRWANWARPTAEVKQICAKDAGASASCLAVLSASPASAA
jgi:hypothetical protein